MQNRVTLAQLCEMTIAEGAALPVDQLAMLLEDLTEMKADTKAKADRVVDVLDAKYKEQAAAARRAAGKDSGTVTLADGDMACTADLPRKVAWDQAKLTEAVAQIQHWGEDPADYCTTEIKVSEAKYNAWPPAIRALFEPARTVSVGSPTYKLAPAKKGKK